MTIAVNVLLALVIWFLLGIVLRDLRIWNRKRMLKRFNDEFNTSFTELEFFNDELVPHRWRKKNGRDSTRH